MSNYEQYIESINSYPYGFINIFYAKSGKKISLKNIDQNNFYEIISYFLTEYFNFGQIQDVKIMTSNGIRNINNLAFNDLFDSIGTIIYVTL
jgi:hypothetical protein